MKFRDLTELAWRNLREALLRNSLTTLGIGVGVASLVAMLSLGVGLQELASQRLSRSGLFDAIIVAPRTNFRGFGRPQQDSSANLVAAGPLDEDARKALEHLPNVVEVYPEIRFPTEIRFDGTPYSTIVAGVPESARTSGAYDGMTGKFFSGPGADEAILQIEFARQLSPQPSTLLGKDLGAALCGAPIAECRSGSRRFQRKLAKYRRKRSLQRIFGGSARREIADRGNR